ncbi:MAG TPA: hypothetical protein VK816_10060 [Jatrophihabitantaceae bacterium]|nr:hypothetical protein [Jatrophihabitantaceae bacterium]
MRRSPCGPLVAWTSAWLCGQAAFDDALSAVDGLGLRDHSAGTALPATGRRPSLSEVLIIWRQARATVRLVLPVAGDVRGLPGPARFRSAALEAGQAVFGGGLAVVPEWLERSPSSAPPILAWHLHEVDEPPVDFLSVSDAQHDLTESIRECASALSAADVAGWVEDVREQLSDARRAGERLNLPARFPPQAVALIAQAQRLAAVLDVAESDPTGGAIDRTGIAARAGALRPLSIAVRRALLAGYNAMS